MQKVINNIYHWMINNLPCWIMYKHIWIDTQHKTSIPRWGWSKKQITDVEERSKEIERNIKWE